MKKRVVAFGLILVLIIAAVGFQTGGILGNFLRTEEVEKETVDINYNNIKRVFSSSEIVQDLPKDASIALSFYNFNTGQRQWGKTYTIRKGEVIDGKIGDVDMEIIIHSKYLQQLTNKNFCLIFQDAKINGDFAAELKLSDPLFLWRYRGMMKYRGCFGL